MYAIKPDGRKIPIRLGRKISIEYALELQGIDITKDTIVFLNLEMSSKDVLERFKKRLKEKGGDQNEKGVTMP